jgi:hypothetical protein
MNMAAVTAIRKLRELRYLAGAREILGTPPVVAREDGVILFSMIGTRVLLPYLVAAKSLHFQLGMGKFAILDDGTLTASDREVLAYHLDDPRIFSINDVDPEPCPKGGCWERLLALLELRRDSYVIQLDSDTVTLGPLPEVAQAIAKGRNFTLKGEAVARWMTVEDFVRTPPFYDWQDPATHVQDVAEALLPQIRAGLEGQTYYVRGCAGFAGFAPGGHGPQLAKDFCQEISALIGKERWSEWGSEQVMSNVIVANEREPALLPYERYLNYWNEPVPGNVSFVHFIGTYRYHGGAYLDATRKAIAALRARG